MLRNLWLLCLLMPMVCVWGAGCLFFIAIDRSHVIPQVAGIWMCNSALVAAPFAFLAVRATSAAKQQVSPGISRFYGSASVVGMIVTLLAWGVFYYDGYSYWTEHRTSGANIGMGCFMLVSPVLVAMAMLAGGAAYSAIRRWRD